MSQGIWPNWAKTMWEANYKRKELIINVMLMKGEKGWILNLSPGKEKKKKKNWFNLFDFRKEILKILLHPPRKWDLTMVLCYYCCRQGWKWLYFHFSYFMIILELKFNFVHHLILILHPAKSLHPKINLSTFTTINYICY